MLSEMHQTSAMKQPSRSCPAASLSRAVETNDQRKEAHLSQLALELQYADEGTRQLRNSYTCSDLAPCGSIELGF